MKSLRVKATPQEDTVKTEPVRRVAQFPPSPWLHYFVDFVQDEEKLDQWKKRAQVLKEEVKPILRKCRGAQYDAKLIDVIKRVGLEEQFEAEIEDALYRLYNNYGSDGHAEDLYHEALRFRVLREGGYKASADVFEKYRDEKGKAFKEILTEDVKGLLSLYEAAFLGIRGEDILDEAIAFTTEHLKSSLTDTTLDPLLAKQVQRALDLPTRKRLMWENARYFILFYEESEGKASDQDMRTLLEYAKLNCNLVQALFQRELMEVLEWWKEIDLAKKVPYGRNLMAEIYFCALTQAPEPRLSRARVFGSKISQVGAFVDDTYDAYGSYEELELFTNAINRWDLAAMDELPEYMKPIYHELITLLEETGEELQREGYYYQIGYMRESMQELCRNYLFQAEWCRNGYTPGTEEYIRVAVGKTLYHASCLVTLVCMKDASVEALEWWKSGPRIMMAAAEMCRLFNDLSGYKMDLKRGNTVTAVQCFMKEKGMTEPEVRDLFNHLYDLEWKEINEACLRPTPFPTCIIGKAVNLARVTELFYVNKERDGFTDPRDQTKEAITALLVEPIPL